MNEHTSPDQRSTGKNTSLATILNFFIPGLGLAYLGRTSLAVGNFLAVAVVLVACFVLNDPAITEHIHWVFMVLMVGSAGVAHGVARSMMAVDSETAS